MRFTEKLMYLQWYLTEKLMFYSDLHEIDGKNSCIYSAGKLMICGFTVVHTVVFMKKPMYFHLYL
jgi:hypothetical protein